MVIAVTTPTGHVGSHVLRALIRAGVRPLALLRDPSKLDPEVAAAVDTRVIDQFDADSVLRATAGVDALYWVVPSVAGDDPLADYARAEAALVRAVTEHGIPKVVLQSSVGAELRHGAGEIDGLAATEVALESTGTCVVHLRCGYFFTNLLYDVPGLRRGLLEVLIPLDQPLPFVAPRDIAEVAAGHLLAPPAGRIVQAMHGPADLTWPEAAAIVAEATGRPLRVERIADDVQRERMLHAGLGPRFIDAVIGMSTGLRDGFVPEQPRTLASTTPTTLGEWAWANLRDLA